MKDSVLNHQFIQNYSKELADRLCGLFFSRNQRVNGNDLKNFTPIRQMNLLLIKELFEQWNGEMEKLKSPYFDYESPEVKEVLHQLMNLLSTRISIERNLMQPLLQKGIQDFILLIFSPYEYFLSEIRKHRKDPIPMVFFTSAKKYITVNTHLYSAFLQKLGRLSLTEISKSEAESAFNGVLSEFHENPDDPDPFIRSLDELLPINTASIYLDIKPDQALTTPSLSDDQKSRTTHGFLSDKVKTDKKSLVDEFQGSPANTIADFHLKKALESIKKNITISQKFLFVRELFMNNEAAFNQVLEDLDTFSSQEEADQYLRDRFFQSGNWTKETEVVEEFISIVKRKFARF
jgi:hypothetical protein